MRIWYQSDAPIGFDPSWENYERSLKRHINEVKLPSESLLRREVKDR